MLVPLPRVGAKSLDLEYRIESRGRRPLYAEARTVQVTFDYEAQATSPVSDDVRRRIAEVDGLAGTQ